MNIVKFGKHRTMAPSLVEVEIKRQDGSRRTWFWFDGSRQDARAEARSKLGYLLDILNRGKHEKNRLKAKDLNVYVDEVKMQSLAEPLPGTVEE